MPTRRCVTIPINFTAWVGGLWATACLLLVVHTIFGPGPWAAWALLISIAASTATLSLVVGRSLNVVLDVISWEHQRTRGEDVEPPPVVLVHN